MKKTKSQDLIELRMDKMEESIQWLNDAMALIIEADKISNKPTIAGRSELDIKVDEVLKNVVIWPDDKSGIRGEGFYLNVETHLSSITLTLLKYVSTDNFKNIPATRDHFDIIETTLEQAELGDLFIVEGYTDIFVAGFKGGDMLPANRLEDSAVECTYWEYLTPSIILRRRK